MRQSLPCHASQSKIVSELLFTERGGRVVHLSYLGDGLIDLGVWCSVCESVEFGMCECVSVLCVSSIAYLLGDESIINSFCR